MGSRYEHVFAPLRIRGVDFRNRLELAPPSPNLASKDGRVTTEFVNLFRSFARGGAAVITIGNSVVDIKEASDEERQLDLSTDECILSLTLFAEMCAGFGTQASLEINHNGKDSDPGKTGKPAYSASRILPSHELWRAPQQGREMLYTIEMDHQKIKETVEKYAQAALRCKRAGMKMTMIHGGHGNLIAQFASRLYNKRTDEYGGSLENRARFATEVLDRVRALCGEDFVIEYRISGDEMREGHMRLPETLEFIKYIKDKVDILHVSAGLHDFVDHMRWLLQNYTMDQACISYLAAEVKKAYPELMVATVGSIKSAAMAEEIIAAGRADIVAFNRGLHADFEMPRKYAEGREWEHMPCLRCRCFRMASPHTSKLCSVNPMWGRYKEYPEARLPSAPRKKKVAVIGGGPAGVEAVKWLLQRGHDVTLYEKSGRIGGRVWDGIALPFKKDLRDYLTYMQSFAENCGARVLLNTEATKELLKNEKYDAIIAAVGADPYIPDIPGADKPFVCWAPDAEKAEVECGQNLVIIGGSTVGTEVAINMAMQGKKVTILEMAKDVNLMDTGAGGPLLEMLEQYGIQRFLGWKSLEITESGVIAQNIDTGEKREFKADSVLFAAGMRSRRKAALEFYDCCPATSFYIIGDCAEVGEIRGAVWTAFEAARYI